MFSSKSQFKEEMKRKKKEKKKGYCSYILPGFVSDIVGIN